MFFTGFFSPTSRNRIRLRLAPYDIACAVFAPFVALAMREPKLLEIPSLDTLPAPYLFACITIACALTSFLAFRLSDGLSRFFSVHDLMAICGAVATTIAATNLFLFTFTRLDGVPRSTPLIYALVLTGLLALGRAFHRIMITEQDTNRAARADRLRNIVIVGADRFSALAIKLIAAQSPRTTRVLALLDERAHMVGRAVNGVRIVGPTQDFAAVVEEYLVHGIEIDQVLISEGVSALSESSLQALQELCQVRAIPMFSLGEALNLTRKEADVLQETEVRAPSIEIPSYFSLKRIVDVFLSLGLLLVLSPVMLVVAGLVLVDVGTPLLFWQERLGCGGRRFFLYKFRTYKAPYGRRGELVAESERLSIIGRFMRASRLDEIPQLLNILVGDMSLVGPRPLLPKDQPDDLSIRLMARPGITGWAQVNGGNMVTPEEKEALDAWYIQHASIWLDLKILLHSLAIAATGERFDRNAISDAMKWRTRMPSRTGFG
jgi:lipopolysaccharide/colanic/teichoic acid biosynthesis glycosyltransferase